MVSRINFSVRNLFKEKYTKSGRKQWCLCEITIEKNQLQNQYQIFAQLNPKKRKTYTLWCRKGETFRSFVLKLSSHLRQRSVHYIYFKRINHAHNQTHDSNSKYKEEFFDIIFIFDRSTKSNQIKSNQSNEIQICFADVYLH